ncbi:DUF1850 domain-containing protein [Planococcus sp. NCCP-2050]|uniref:DUF1850 domain-containing protein n=1 Tax=Planococcus sp. NCCP-2050 TaxID=2944679 RepID=UPI002040E03E|nr:DUF1850 domain-containing protein [Planococcus sp. NCCP-2050]GKW45070.1 hypothetical protein NCCP2050_07620 [Planococcus sp. NCCP-2050]
MPKKTNQWILLSVLALILILAVIIFIPIEKKIVFIDNREGTLAAFIKTENDAFQINYTHSIHLSEVLESYKIMPDNRIRMVELEYEDFNIGMPSNAGEGETFVEKDGKYLITNMEREVDDFRLFVGDVDAHLFFLADGHQYNLKKTLERGKSYTIKVQRVSLFEQLEGVSLNER